jgi:hypothetical protein
MQRPPCDRRISRVLARAWSPYIGAALLLWGLELAIFVTVMHEYFPEVDINSWPVIAIATPPVLVAAFFHFLMGSILFVRAFAKKKGRNKTLRYLVPDCATGQGRFLNRLFLRVIGARSVP